MENQTPKPVGPIRAPARKRPVLPERKARRREINAGIRQVYDAVVNEPLPPSFQEWLAAGPLAHESAPARNEPQP